MLLVYPGGGLEACRPWTQRDKVDFGGRKRFVQLALRCGVPVVPVAAHGGHHTIVVLTRGDRLARTAGLPKLRINVLPLLAGHPFGVNSVFTPPLPMPAHLTLEFLSPLDWTPYGPDAADDPRIVAACYTDITTRLQAAVNRLSVEHPHPVLLDAHGSPGRQQPARYTAPETSAQPRAPPANTTSPRATTRSPARLAAATSQTGQPHGRGMGPRVAANRSGYGLHPIFTS